MSKFELCEKAGLKIEPCRHGFSSVYDDVVRASDVESLLARAPVVYGVENIEKNSLKHLRDWADGVSTHTARLLMIEPIVRESEERQALREILRIEDEDPHNIRPGQWQRALDRARALLAKGGGNG